MTIKKANPDKMIPVGALGPVWTYVFVNGREKALGFKPMPRGQKQTLKKFHKRRCRRLNKKIDEE